MFPFSEKTYYPKTALIQVLTSAWPKKESRVQPNYNNLRKAEAGSSYSQRLSMRQKNKYAPWTYFCYLFSCMKMETSSTDSVKQASISAYKYLPNSKGIIEICAY